MRTKTILLFLLLFIVRYACAQQTNTYNITGHIDNVTDGAVIQLHAVEGNSGRLVKTDTIRNGSFSFEGETDSLRKLMLTAHGGKFISYFRPIWIMPGSNSKISGEDTICLLGK